MSYIFLFRCAANFSVRVQSNAFYFLIFFWLFPQQCRPIVCHLLALKAQRDPFLGAFAQFRKATIASSRLSVCMERLGSHWTDCREILYLMVFFLLKFVEKIQVSLISDSNKGYFT